MGIHKGLVHLLIPAFVFLCLDARKWEQQTVLGQKGKSQPTLKNELKKMWHGFRISQKEQDR
jgi:hypothetical protein